MEYRSRIGISILLLALSGVEAQQNDDQFDVTAYRNTLNQYCVGCHNDVLKTADLALNQVDPDNIAASPEVWEKVLLKLQTRSMPPVGMPRPNEDFYISLAAHLEDNLDAIVADNPNPGQKINAHRLNRTEYTNAIRDLLAVEIDGVTMLPADNSGEFDNLGNLLSVSELLMEKYMTAARQISRLAVGDTSLETDVNEYLITPFLLQNERMSEDLPFGTRGGMAVSHRFPLDGEYVLNIRLQKTDNTGFVIGLDRPHRLDVRIDGKRIKLLKIGGDNVALALGSGRADKVPPDFEQAQYERTADNELQINFPVTAGDKLIQVAFLEENFAWEEPVPQRTYDNYSTARLDKDYERAWTNPSISSVGITGPFNVKGSGSTASRDIIFICNPKARSEEEACAKKILSSLARRAYRRTIAPEDLEPLFGLYLQGNKQGGSFDAGIQMGIEGLLVSTEFLFRIEREPANPVNEDIYALNDFELASRLSFFLWSSIPDGELLTVAENGKLNQPEILEQQVKRMLKDERAFSLINNFAEQWLLLRNLPHTDKNQELFPEFDDNLCNDLQEETRLFLASILLENRSILDLFRADHKYVNERLARHYEIPGVFGNRFRRVTVNDDNKKGLLAQGSILAITSYPNRTSPVLRGKWVLENILAAPPPPPPTVIPPLKEDDDDGRQLSMREAIEKHRANPVCATCHNRMDPIGFGLENFNPIGQWREVDAGDPIDSSGMLPDGSNFQGPAELQHALLSQSRVIASAFTQKLLTYALGRDIEYYDMATVREIIDNARDEDYRFTDIVLGVVNSLPFKMRRTDT